MTIFEEAAEIIDGDREKTYGDPSANLRRIAGIWSVVLGMPITVDQVCMCMIGLKLARLVNDPTHRDGKVDLCGYTLLMTKIQEQAKGAE